MTGDVHQQVLVLKSDQQNPGTNEGKTAPTDGTTQEVEPGTKDGRQEGGGQIFTC